MYKSIYGLNPKFVVKNKEDIICCYSLKDYWDDCYRKKGKLVILEG